MSCHLSQRKSDRLRHAPIERFLTSIELERHSKDIFLSHTWLTSGRQVVFVCNLLIALWHTLWHSIESSWHQVWPIHSRIVANMFRHRLKVVSLLFQSGWKFAVFCWLLSVILADILVVTEVLPVTFRHVLVSSMLGGYEGIMAIVILIH